MSVQPTTLTWEQLLEFAQNHTLARRIRRPGQLPSSAPVPSGLHKLSPETPLSVVLYRDANSWCPFCERVWFALEEKQIPFLTEFIDLFNKPQWYIERVPSGLVPTVQIKGEFVYESTMILLALETRFRDTPLFPSDPHEATIAIQRFQDAETNLVKDTGYKFLMEKQANAQAVAALQSGFEAKLDELEQALSEYPGPYFFSTFSLVDIMYAPHLDRLAVSLPVYRNYHIKGSPRFPRLTAWLDALNERPAYQRVKTDAVTFNLLMQQLWKLEPIADPLPLNPLESSAMRYRAEAAERLSDNREAAIADIFKKSGVQSLIVAGDISAVKTAIEVHLKLLAAFLLHGDEVLSSCSRISHKEHLDSFSAAVGAITLAYVRNRICVPRDMSAGAATAFRAAADAVLIELLGNNLT